MFTAILLDLWCYIKIMVYLCNHKTLSKRKL